MSFANRIARSTSKLSSKIRLSRKSTGYRAQGRTKRKLHQAILIYVLALVVISNDAGAWDNAGGDDVVGRVEDFGEVGCVGWVWG